MQAKIQCNTDVLKDIFEVIHARSQVSEEGERWKLL